MRSAPAALGLSLLLTLIAALENTVAPWAPFYVVYAALALFLPMLPGAGGLGLRALPRLRHCLAAAALAILLQGIVGLMFRTIDLAAMFGQVFAVATVRLGRPPEAIAGSYLLFIVIWAGLGEEVFYRGYVQRSFRRRFGPVVAITGASLIYATRHYAQVLITWPHVPWWPATVWVAATFVVGLAIGWLYEKTGSLWPPILCHYLFNLLA